MYRILISEEIEKKAHDFSNNLFSQRRSNFVKPHEALIALYNQIEVVEPDISENEKRDALENFKAYIKNLAMLFDRIVNLHPREYDWYQDHFFSMVKENQFSYKCKYGEKRDSFYMLVVEDCLRYSYARDEFISFVRTLNIQSCVYCNMHSLESCSDSSGDFATYQLDHFKDKRDYPFLGINFYNMVPSCSYCNQKKSKNVVPFFLYRLNESEEKNPFKFIFPNGFSAYFTEQKKENIYYKFDVGSWQSYQHESVFKIQTRYEARLDEIEDFLKNILVFVPEYIELYRKSFPQMPFDVIAQDKINRLLKDKLDYSQVHECSYTKIRLDIAQELCLIPQQSGNLPSKETHDLYDYFLARGFCENGKLNNCK